jgi:hypothetical protein
MFKTNGELLTINGNIESNDSTKNHKKKQTIRYSELTIKVCIQKEKLFEKKNRNLETTIWDVNREPV